MDINEVWDDTLKILKEKINSVSYNVYIKTMAPVLFENSIFTASVTNELSKNMIDFRYKNLIESSIEAITNEKINLKVIVAKEDEPEKIIEDIKINESPTSLDTVNPKYTFENFVIGSSNEYATAAAISTTEKPGYIYNPLFLYGNSGLGKTHLMQAIGNRIKQNHPDFNVVYVTTECFTNEFIAAVREGKMVEFRKKYRPADVLLVDDVQFMENKEATQEEFFHTFNDLYSLNKQIVLTSDRKPNDLITLEERLRTRFSQGLTIDITIPNYETRMAILQKKAEFHNVHISEEVLSYIADRIKSNIRELEGALLKIISYSELSHTDITLELAKQTLKSILPEDGVVKITPDKIMDKVAVFYNVSKEDLIGSIRTKNIAFPRQIAMYLCKKLTDMNFGMIGKTFGNKDRTTVMHNVNKIEKEINTNESLKIDINYILKDLESM
ncbi:MAG: chromosomal replication initiator protein DnaA [Clostridia bacterium]|nr:chromosomal replication initiator protein DnaA [Clostridia bacterium]